MSGGGNTSISGMRSPGGSRRGDTARISKGISGGSVTVHVIILGLAVLLWWIARDMVSVSQQLNNAGRVRFELSEELQGEWRVFSQATVPVSLDVSGPTKEINDFAADLDQNPGRFAYRYEITAADIANLTVNSRQQLTLTLDIRRFEATTEAVAPPELRVRPVGATSGEKGGIFNVVLERYIERSAYVDLGASAKGQIQVDVKDGSRTETRAYSYTAEARLDKEIELWGPASLVEANSDANGQGRLKLVIDAKEALENFTAARNPTIEQVLEQGSLVTKVQLAPIEGVTIRDAQGIEVLFVNVRVAFTRLQDYVPVSGNFPVEPIFPNWLAQGQAYVENLPASILVDMRVLSSQQSAFSGDNVRVRLDLSSLERGELTIESIEGSNLKRARVQNNLYYSLDINTARITYEFINEAVTAERYQPVEVVIVWTED